MGQAVVFPIIFHHISEGSNGFLISIRQAVHTAVFQIQRNDCAVTFACLDVFRFKAALQWAAKLDTAHRSGRGFQRYPQETAFRKTGFLLFCTEGFFTSGFFRLEGLPGNCRLSCQA